MGTSAPEYAAFKTELQGLQSRTRVQRLVAEAVPRARHLSLDDETAIPGLLARVSRFKGIQLTQDEEANAARILKLHLQTMPT